MLRGVGFRVRIPSTEYCLGFRVVRQLSNAGVSQNCGYHFGGPENKDYSIGGVHVGVPLFRESTISSIEIFWEHVL